MRDRTGVGAELHGVSVDEPRNGTPGLMGLEEDVAVVEVADHDPSAVKAPEHARQTLEEPVDARAGHPAVAPTALAEAADLFARDQRHHEAHWRVGLGVPSERQRGAELGREPPREVPELFDAARQGRRRERRVVDLCGAGRAAAVHPGFAADPQEVAVAQSDPFRPDEQVDHEASQRRTTRTVASSKGCCERALSALRCFCKRLPLRM